MIKNRPSYLLVVLVFAQFAGTTLWLSGNAVSAQLEAELGLKLGGWLTSAVQMGFILGTLLNAIFAVPERVLSSRLFVYSALLGALANISITILPFNTPVVLISRLLTGMFLAGIYPIGMKIAADWYGKDLSRAMGYLVGALVLGKAFPYLLKGLSFEWPWRAFLYYISLIALFGGLLLWVLLPDKPLPSQHNQFSIKALGAIFKLPELRAAAFGYFGHMWELYAFWAFVPAIWKTYLHYHPEISFNVYIATFGVIVVGFLGCWLGGLVALRIGSGKVALVQLLISGICCLLLPIFGGASMAIFALLMFVWGVSVVGDSPQFSTLVSRFALPERRGSIITLVTSIGFAITIFSIQLIDFLLELYPYDFRIFWVLCLGPIFGIWSSYRKFASNRSNL
ncbi:major facilitator superfamily MFS_1 [Emticicia oligotrophica DSM 17448]|uniref:Major facilitator superfamily MFS_1 n=1 Tax=Emticicia oligotrophica (strain DSM 17448 / CIP 109782 / MTCC 6937 / GPTSA100-15) TaxID=929562 RepID=A0ABN4ANS4_EMTOG|nr:MFS transporter [Emticicia oligotrophica]AFK03828.1 major facilitator superfamily MFS_1 [Emticicia oligotrophica DSM 17448]